MRKRKLGRTGYHVSELGFAARGLGSPWRGVEPRQAQRALYRAVESGIDLVDAAPDHGDSEALVGEVIRDLRARDTVVVATAVPPLSSDGPAGDRAGIAGVFPAGYVVTSVEQSLRRQRAEVLCIAQLDGWRDDWLESAAWHDLRGTMAALIQAGKVLHWGISAADPVVGVLDDPLIETVKVVHNIFDRGVERVLSGRAREREVGVIAGAPFDGGVLTGALDPTLRKPSEGQRAPERHPTLRKPSEGQRAPERQFNHLERVDALRSLLGGEVDTLAELALRFCLSSDDVSTIVAGMRRTEHVDQNIAACERGALTAELCERLLEHARDRNSSGNDRD